VEIEITLKILNHLTFMRIFLPVFSSLLFFTLARGQTHQSNWDNYVMEVNRRPVSVVVDLGLKTVAPMKERPYVVIIRTKILSPESNGQPGKAERARLDEMEEKLEDQLSRYCGALYAGRFTQRGIREFYFYALDSIEYVKAVQTAMAGFTDYQYLCQAKEDKAWENYQQVLYPSEKDMEAILNRRQIDLLASKGDPLSIPRRIDHHFVFSSKSKREEFVRSMTKENFQLASMEDGPEGGEMSYSLHMYRDDIPAYSRIAQLFLPLWENARKLQGRYLGWETYVVR
jgi:uncharacterized protein (TIGR01619 family)